MPHIIIISLHPPPSGLRQSLLLNVALLTSKQEPQSEMLSENALPISSQLSCNSEVSWIIIKTKPRKLLPPMELPSPTSVIFCWGVQPMWTTDRWRGSCCSLQSPLSPSSSLILHSSLWLSEQPRSDIAACCISTLVTISLPALSIKVSTSLAIRVRHRLFDAELADWAELNQHR